MMIGMMNTIQDESAILLAREFYTRFTEKEDAASALQTARKKFIEKQLSQQKTKEQTGNVAISNG